MVYRPKNKVTPIIAEKYFELAKNPQTCNADPDHGTSLVSKEPAPSNDEDVEILGSAQNVKSNDSIIDVEQGQRHDPIRIETAECSEKEKPGNEGLLVDKTPSLIHETTKLAEVSIDRIEQTMQDVRNSLIHDSEVAQPSRFEALSLIQEEE